MAPARSWISPALLVALGTCGAAALIAAAAADLGDPLAAARARATTAARLELEAASAAAASALAGSPRFDAALRSQTGTYGAALNLPTGHLPRLRRVARGASKDARWEDSVRHRTSRREDSVRHRTSQPLTAALALVESAETAAARGQLADGVVAVREALSAATNDVERARAHLLGARLWSRLGEQAELEAHRAALLALEEDSELDGTSVKLLACLVDPALTAPAVGLLVGGAPLPAPDDRIELRDGALRFTSDPWWAAIEDALVAGGLSASHAQEALGRPSRFATAARQWAAVELGEATPSWTVHSPAPDQVAFQRDQGPSPGLLADTHELVLVDEATAWELLTTAGGAHVPALELAPEGAAKGEPLAGPLEIPGLPGARYVVHPDPEAEGRAEARRLSALRWALNLLAAAILIASLVAARAMARSRRLAALRSTFVASVSHDLRTPVQGILLMAETLEDGRLGERAPERLPRYYGRIRREAERLRRLVEDLLDSARIDRGDGARVEREDVGSEAWFAELAAALKERATAADASLSLERGPLPERLHVDPLGVHRAVWNVFENALLHGRSTEGSLEVKVSIEAQERALIVTLTDSGPGIPRARRESVFQPFERLRGTGRRRADPDRDTGTGLGLAITRALCRAHGGDARLLDAARGATFELRFESAFDPARLSPADELPV